MRLGALVLQEQPWRAARSSWARLEALGFDAAYAADHLTHRHVAGKWWADGWTTLAAAAGVTERMRLGTLVASAAVRTPASLARAAATLQDISGGRFVLGIGAGLPADVLADRGERSGNAELFARYEETVSAVRALWLGSSTWVGRHVRFEGVEPAPHAPHMLPPPIVLSAGGPKGFDLAARQGDGWVTFGGPGTAGLSDDDWWSAVAAQSSQVTAACERIERDPARIDRRVLVGWSGPQPWAARDALGEILGRAGELGFHEVVVYAPVGEPGERFWADPDLVEASVTGLRAVS